MKKFAIAVGMPLLVGVAVAGPANAEPLPTPTTQKVQELQPGLTSLAAAGLALDARDACNSEMANQILGGATDWNAYFKDRGANVAVTKLLAEYAQSCRIA